MRALLLLLLTAAQPTETPSDATATPEVRHGFLLGCGGASTAHWHDCSAKDGETKKTVEPLDAEAPHSLVADCSNIPCEALTTALPDAGAIPVPSFLFQLSFFAAGLVLILLTVALLQCLNAAAHGRSAGLSPLGEARVDPAPTLGKSVKECMREDELLHVMEKC